MSVSNYDNWKASNPADDELECPSEDNPMNTTRAMAEFVRWAMNEGPWEGLGLDGEDIQSKAESLGLIVRSPDRSDWFVLSPGVVAALNTTQERS